jgi:hypothetical protein
MTHIVMGTVFMAEQHEPVKRRVVLKVNKPGINTGTYLSQFLNNGDFPCVCLSEKFSFTRPQCR